MTFGRLAGCLLIAFGGLNAIGNGIAAYDFYRHGKTVSMFPFASGITGTCGLLLLLGHYSSWIWIPMFLDYASIPGTVLMCIRVYRRRLR